jgi:YVTN family beta-propeller protein
MTRARALTASAVAIAMLAACGTGTGVPAGGSPSAAASATPTVRPSRPTPAPTPTLPLVGVPIEETVSGVKTTSIRLGQSSAPIDVAYGFGSIWVANHHSNDVSRLDPETLEVIAQIKTGSGPAWFAVTDDAVWVSNQNALGVTRIDPATNTASAPFGDKPPCGPLAVAGGMVWQFACDSHRYVRFDATTNASTEVPEDHGFLLAVGPRLFAGGDKGMVEIDPGTGSVVRQLSESRGWPVATDGTTVWLITDSKVLRIDIETGEELVALPVSGAANPAASTDRLWLPVGNHGVDEIELPSYQTLRTIEILPSPLIAIEAAGYLWVTNYDTSTLWRLEP